MAGRRLPRSASVPPAGKPVRVVVSSEQLLQRLEGKLQQAAEKAVDSAMSARFGAAVNQAAKAIDEFSQSSVRKVQKQYEQYREQMVISAREQFLSRVQADLAAAEERLERRVETLLAAPKGRREELAGAGRPERERSAGTGCGRGGKLAAKGGASGAVRVCSAERARLPAGRRHNLATERLVWKSSRSRA